MTHWKSVLGVRTPLPARDVRLWPRMLVIRRLPDALEEAWEGESRTRPSRVARTEVIDPCVL